MQTPVKSVVFDCDRETATPKDYLDRSINCCKMTFHKTPDRSLREINGKNIFGHTPVEKDFGDFGLSPINVNRQIDFKKEKDYDFLSSQFPFFKAN